MPNCLLWDVTGGLTHGSHSACLIADLFVGTSTEAQYSTSAAGVNLLHRNRGNGYYDEISTTAISELVTDTKGASWGDMDGDGDLVKMCLPSHTSVPEHEYCPADVS